MSDVLVISIIILILMFFVISLASKLVTNNSIMQKRHLKEIKIIYEGFWRELKGLSIQTTDVQKLANAYMSKVVEIDEFESRINSH